MSMPTQKANTNKTPAGYKTTRTGELHKIFKFEKEGDNIAGRYCGIKTLPSEYSKEGSVLWMLADAEGEIFLVNEKTTMKDLRISTIKEGDEILVVFNGVKQGKKRQYKDFEVFIKE
jgi:hypothetical protein